MRHRTALLVASALLAAISLTSSATAAVGPLYGIKATWGPTPLAPGDTKPTTAEGQFAVQVRNVGDATAAKDLIITDKLPTGVTAVAVNWPGTKDFEAKVQCSGAGSNEVKCKLPAAVVADFVPPAGLKFSQASVPFSPKPSGFLNRIFIDVSVAKNAEGEATNTATVSGGGAPAPVSDVDQVRFDETPVPFDIVPGSFLAENFDEAHPFGEPTRQASNRPFELRVNFDLTTRTGVNDGPGQDGTRYITSTGQLRTVEVTLPRGMIGNPEAVPKCNPTDFAEQGALLNSTACPSDTQVGYLNIYTNDGPSNYGDGQLINLDQLLLNRVALYNLEPPRGQVADLAFNAGGLVQGHIYPTPDPAQEYAIKSVTANISSLVQVRGTEVTIWGVPGDPAHDRFRWYTKKQEDDGVLGAPWGSAPIRPFLTNPMDCGFDNGGARISIDSYNHPEEFSAVTEYGDAMNVTGCEDPRFRFEPEISLQPTDRHAGAPTGLDVHLEVPQRNDEVSDATELYAKNGDVQAIATPPIKKAVVTFPQEMTLSPSAAQGLVGCTLEQIGLGTDRPVRCPDASQYGTLTLHTPLFPLEAQPKGFIYIAKQSENPFHNFLALYLVVEEPERGILVKVAGRLDLDPKTGQITTTFEDLPQFPVSDMQMTFKGGVRAGLVQPSTCGKKTILAEFFSWHDPLTPHTVKSSYDITERLDGSPCVNSLGERPFGPFMEAGTTNNTAGSYSPFAFRLTRTDDDQEFSQLGVTLPPGLAAKFAGVGICPDAAIAQAEGRTGAGEGLLEQMSPSCPASSEIGSTQVGTGVGVPLTYVPGRVYLSGPYKGAPLSIVVISPAVVGPYDLGVIAVRTALNVDPTTAQGSALSDPFPQIFQGIPVRIRDIRLKLDRPSFTLNPTSCAEKQITAHVTGTGGEVSSTADDTGADLANRFQAGDCGSLGFKPKLAFRLFGGTSRGAHPRLRATVTYPQGAYANIAKASVALPHSAFLDQGHIGTVCTRVQFAADACPAASVYGSAVVKTPLFGQPLQGAIYLRSSSNPLPDLVAAFKGPPSQPVEVNLVGRIDSVNGGIRNTFDLVPDAPVSWATFSFLGGKKGLLVNSANLCAKANRVTAKLTAQNGRWLTLRPAMQNSCKKRRRGKRDTRNRRRS